MPDYPPDITEKARECAKDACPSDIREFGERHKIPRFAEATYGNGFIDGYRQGALAERQRCAAVAQLMAKTATTDDIAQICDLVAMVISAGPGATDTFGKVIETGAAADAIMNPEPTDDR